MLYDCTLMDKKNEKKKIYIYIYIYIFLNIIDCKFSIILMMLLHKMPSFIKNIEQLTEIVINCL